jgi:hypothetical protein
VLALGCSCAGSGACCHIPRDEKNRCVKSGLWVGGIVEYSVYVLSEGRIWYLHVSGVLVFSMSLRG